MSEPENTPTPPPATTPKTAAVPLKKETVRITLRGRPGAGVTQPREATSPISPSTGSVPASLNTTSVVPTMAKKATAPIQLPSAPLPPPAPKSSTSPVKLPAPPLSPPSKRTTSAIPVSASPPPAAPPPSSPMPPPARAGAPTAPPIAKPPGAPTAPRPAAPPMAGLPAATRPLHKIPQPRQHLVLKLAHPLCHCKKVLRLARLAAEPARWLAHCPSAKSDREACPHPGDAASVDLCAAQRPGETQRCG
jgi:hypothetical protein